MLNILLAAMCSLTEGIGILLLIPVLQVSGLNLVGQGTVGRFAARVDSALRWMQLTPSLPVLLFIFLILISTRTVTVKLQMITGSTVQEKLQSYLRERLHRAIVDAVSSYYVATNPRTWCMFLRARSNGCASGRLLPCYSRATCW